MFLLLCNVSLRYFFGSFVDVGEFAGVLVFWLV